MSCAAQKPLTFREWSRLFYDFLPDSKQSKTIFKNMISLARTYEEWKEIYGKADMNTQREILNLAGQKMAELAETFDEAWLAYCLSFYASTAEKIARKKIKEFASTPEERKKADKL